MSNKMYLYKVSWAYPTEYAEYKSIVCVAASSEIAKHMHPLWTATNQIEIDDMDHAPVWAVNTSELNVVTLRIANNLLIQQVLCKEEINPS